MSLWLSPETAKNRFVRPSRLSVRKTTGLLTGEGGLSPLKKDAWVRTRTASQNSSLHGKREAISADRQRPQLVLGWTASMRKVNASSGHEFDFGFAYADRAEAARSP